MKFVSLAEDNPQLAVEWSFLKNKLLPNEVSKGRLCIASGHAFGFIEKKLTSKEIAFVRENMFIQKQSLTNN